MNDRYECRHHYYGDAAQKQFFTQRNKKRCGNDDQTDHACTEYAKSKTFPHAYKPDPAFDRTQGVSDGFHAFLLTRTRRGLTKADAMQTRIRAAMIIMAMFRKGTIS